jgi:hypothetical protein
MLIGAELIIVGRAADGADAQLSIRREEEAHDDPAEDAHPRR